MGRLAEGRLTLGALQGHWRRDWLRWPGRDGGGEDATTRVHWLQAGALYADIRVPAERPPLDGARCLADLDPPALAGLAAAEGFAGTVTLDGEICTWHRAVNWHGRPEAVDAGRLWFSEGALIEDGVYAAYRERWVAAGPTGAAPEGWRLAAGALSGLLVTVGETFALALGQPDAPPSRPLLDALRAGRRPDGLAALFEGLHALGQWQGDEGVAELCTDPFLEGAPVLRRAGSRLTLCRRRFDGSGEDLSLEAGADTADAAFPEQV